MRGYRTCVLGLCASFVVSGSVWALGGDPFRDSDPIHDTGLARLADEAGDAAIAAALGPEGAREKALLAVRAAPFAQAPELLIPQLLGLALGRDPNVAPEAAQALRQIGLGLRPSDLAAREVLIVDLRRVRQAVREAQGSAKSVRADITRDLDLLASDLDVALAGTAE